VPSWHFSSHKYCAIVSQELIGLWRRRSSHFHRSWPANKKAPSWGFFIGERGEVDKPVFDENAGRHFRARSGIIETAERSEGMARGRKTCVSACFSQSHLLGIVSESQPVQQFLTIKRA
jgi:hypothetical protein